MYLPRVEASTKARNPRYIPIHKSDMARLQIRKRVTSILDLLVRETNSTVPFPRTASRNTIQTPHLKDHQPNKSSHGWKGSERYKRFNASINIAPS